jgi:hypothetical protein
MKPKTSIMNSIRTMLQRILELGQGDPSSVNDDTNRLHIGTKSEENEVQMVTESTDVSTSDADAPKPEEKRENVIVSFIEVAAKVGSMLTQVTSLKENFNKAFVFLIEFIIVFGRIVPKLGSF